MKKTKKHRNDSLNRLREIIGMTQSEFAKLIGVSVDLVKGVESGRNPLSSKLARKIRIATGADVEAGAGKSPMYFGDDRYEKVHFTDWTTRMSPSSPARAWYELDETVLPAMTLMWIATTRPAIGGKVKHRMPALFESWCLWLKETVESLGLQPQIQKLLDEVSPEIRDSKTLAWGAWRSPEKQIYNWNKLDKKARAFGSRMHTAMQKAYHFKDDVNKPDTELLTLTASMRLVFTPGAGLPHSIVKSLRDKFKS